MILGLGLGLGGMPAVVAKSPDWIDAIPANVFERAMVESAQGFSTDEVILRDDLRDAFLASVTKHTDAVVSESDHADLLLRLLKIRKAGKLNYRTLRRHSPKTGDVSVPDVSVVAEIAAHAVCDRHRITTDTILVHAKYRDELQREANLITPGTNAYALRKSVLNLRKRRAFRPELVLQVADWDRQVTTSSLKELIRQLDNDGVPHQPGVYLFRTKDGYLYIGEAADLSNRLTQHTTASDRKTLAAYLAAAANDDEVSVELHVFPRESPAAKVKVRRAYESELIRSRHPKLNVRP